MRTAWWPSALVMKLLSKLFINRFQLYLAPKGTSIESRLHIYVEQRGGRVGLFICGRIKSVPSGGSAVKRVSGGGYDGEREGRSDSFRRHQSVCHHPLPLTFHLPAHPPVAFHSSHFSVVQVTGVF